MSAAEMAAEVTEWELRLATAPVGATVTVESVTGFESVIEEFTKDAKLEGWRIGDTAEVLGNHDLALMVAADATEVIA